MNRKILATVAAGACLLALLALPRPHTGSSPEAPRLSAPAALPATERSNTIPVVRVYIPPDDKHVRGFGQAFPADPLGEELYQRAEGAAVYSRLRPAR